MGTTRTPLPSLVRWTGQSPRRLRWGTKTKASSSSNSNNTTNWDQREGQLFSRRMLRCYFLCCSCCSRGAVEHKWMLSDGGVLAVKKGLCHHRAGMIRFIVCFSLLALGCCFLPFVWTKLFQLSFSMYIGKAFPSKTYIQHISNAHSHMTTEREGSSSFFMYNIQDERRTSSTTCAHMRTPTRTSFSSSELDGRSILAKSKK